MGPKDSLAELLHRTGVTRGLARPRADLLIVFGYHRIRSPESEHRTAFDDGVIGPTPERFREQLAWLKRHTRILSEQELIDTVEQGEPLPEACSMITFDDGYRDNYTLALPVLEELGVPATFFVPSRLIDVRRLGWWDLIAYFIKESRKDPIVLDGQRYDLGRRQEGVIKHFHRMMRLRPAEETADLLEKLSAACEVPFPSRAAQDAELMSWEELRDAVTRGVTVGSHSHSHRVLKTLDRPSVDDELRSSKALLESKVGVEVRTLAYPCGSYEDFDQAVQRAAVAAGYRLAFSFNTGVQRFGQLAPFDIRRLGAPEGPARLAAITVFPGLFEWAA